MKMIELRRLRYLVTVADEGHITRAAERLGIQQPPLTRQIRQLEAELGVTLFERLPRGMQVTEAGRIVVEEARDVLARAERIRETAQRAARGEQGRLAVGYTSSAAFHPFVTQQIRAFRDARPGVVLALAEEGTTELLQAIKDERLDAAFIRSTSNDLSGLSVDPLLEEKMVLAVPADHPLAQQPKASLGDLAEETFIFYRRPSGPGLYDAIMAACLAAGFSPKVGQEAPRMASTLSLVASGLGVAITPASMQRMNVEGVAFVRLKGTKGLTAPVLLATRKRDRALLVDRFRREVRAAAKALEQTGAPPQGELSRRD